MRVSDWMKKDVLTVKPRESVAHARQLLETHRFNQLPVAVEGRLVAIITDRDLRDAFPSVFEGSRRSRLARSGVDPDHVLIEQVMTANVVTVAPSDTLENAARVMRRERIGALPVVEDGKLVGILTRSDLLDALVALSEAKPDRGTRAS